MQRPDVQAGAVERHAGDHQAPHEHLEKLDQVRDPHRIVEQPVFDLRDGQAFGCGRAAAARTAKQGDGGRIVPGGRVDRVSGHAGKFTASLRRLHGDPFRSSPHRGFGGRQAMLYWSGFRNGFAHGCDTHRFAGFRTSLRTAVRCDAGAAQERVALVIGNGNYVNAGVLTNPANDARAVAASLRAIGFDVTEGVDLGRGQMEDQIRAFLNKATSAKVALLYYAGHGMQIDGRNYLVPVDAKLQTLNDVTFGTVELDRVLSGLNDPSRASIVVLDACRDNPMARIFASNTRSAAVGTGLAAYATVGTGTLIAYSTAPGKVAADGNRGNSPFSESFAKHLRMPGLEVTAIADTRAQRGCRRNRRGAGAVGHIVAARRRLPCRLARCACAGRPARKIETLPAPQSPGFKPASAAASAAGGGATAQARRAPRGQLVRGCDAGILIVTRCGHGHDRTNRRSDGARRPQDDLRRWQHHAEDSAPLRLALRGRTMTSASSLADRRTAASHCRWRSAPPARAAIARAMRDSPS